MPRHAARKTLAVLALAALPALAVATLPFDGQGYPGSLPWRIAACLWGLGGFVLVYLLPLFRLGWWGVNRELSKAYSL